MGLGDYIQTPGPATYDMIEAAAKAIAHEVLTQFAAPWYVGTEGQRTRAEDRAAEAVARRLTDLIVRLHGGAEKAP